MRRLFLVFGVLALAAGAWVAAQPAGSYDLIIRNGLILDGTGNPWVRGDVAVAGDAIAAIAPIVRGRGRQEIDARSLVISPGFIDLHTHARRGIFEVPTAENYVRQGVTTIFEGPDGGSPVPLAPFMAKLEALKMSANFGMFIGQGSVREAVMGRVDRPATPDELAKMKDLARQGMLDGAFGISSGLFYVPGIFTPTDEVIAVSAVAGQMGGIYISHMRNEAAAILDSVKETVAVGERGRMPSQITHHKIIGRKNWGLSAETLKLVAEARTRGVDVTIDQHCTPRRARGSRHSCRHGRSRAGRPTSSLACATRPSARASRRPSSSRCRWIAAAAIRRTWRSRPAGGIRRWRERTLPRSRRRGGRAHLRERG